MKINIQIIRACFIALLLFAVKASAQDITAKAPPIIRTNGDAVVMVKPDRAQIDVGVVTQAATSQAAAEQNAKQIDAVLSELKKLLGAESDVKTIGYTLMPNYRYVPNAEPTTTGYTATNIVRVGLDDLTQLAKVIDTASAAGANRIQSLQFILKNPQAVQAQALSDAARNARRKADLVASTMNLKIVRVLSITDATQPIYYPSQNTLQIYAGNGNSAGTPITPRTIEIRANVTLTVEIAP